MKVKYVSLLVKPHSEPNAQRSVSIFLRPFPVLSLRDFWNRFQNLVVFTGRRLNDLEVNKRRREEDSEGREKTQS